MAHPSRLLHRTSSTTPQVLLEDQIHVIVLRRLTSIPHAARAELDSLVTDGMWRLVLLLDGGSELHASPLGVAGRDSMACVILRGAARRHAVTNSESETDCGALPGVAE